MWKRLKFLKKCENSFYFFSLFFFHFFGSSREKNGNSWIKWKLKKKWKFWEKNENVWKKLNNKGNLEYCLSDVDKVESESRNLGKNRRIKIKLMKYKRNGVPLRAVKSFFIKNSWCFYWGRFSPMVKKILWSRPKWRSGSSRYFI